MKIRSLIAALALASSMFVATTAQADLVSINPNPTVFGNGMIEGTITLVSCSSGVPVGGTVLEGSVGATDQTLVFEITMTQGSLGRYGIGAWQGQVGTGTGVNSNGAGVIFGPGVDTEMFELLSGNTERIFEFDGGFMAGGTLDAGETSEQFFVSLDADSLVDGDELSFMITPLLGLGSTFSIAVPLVPGPGSLVALVGAFALVSAKRRRRC